MPTQFKALGYMLIFCFSLPFGDTLVRLLAETGMKAAQVMCVRSLVSMSILAPLLYQLREFRIPKVYWKWYLLRSALFFVAVWSWLSVIDKIPLPQLYAIGFTAPILSSVLSVLILKERFTRVKAIALIGGFMGVLLIIRPGLDGFSLLNLVPLFCALNWASAQVISKHLSGSQSPYQMTFVLSSSFVLFTSGISVVQWVPPTQIQWGILVVLGGLIVLTHTCLVRAYKLADLSLLAPFEFLNLVFASLLGWMFFSEVVDFWTIFGGCIIFGSALVATLSKPKSDSVDDLKWAPER